MNMRNEYVDIMLQVASIAMSIFAVMKLLKHNVSAMLGFISAAALFTIIGRKINP